MNKPNYLPLRRLTKPGIVLALLATTAGLVWRWNKLDLDYGSSIQALLPQSTISVGKGNNMVERLMLPSIQDPARNTNHSTQDQPLANIDSPGDTSHVGKHESLKSIRSPINDSEHFIAGVRVVPLDQQNFPKDYIKEVKRMQRDIAQQMETKGFVAAEDFAVLMIHAEAQEIAKTKSTPPDMWTEKLGFRPTDLRGTELEADSKYIGLIPSQSMLAETTDRSGNNSSEKYISRLYQSDNLGLIKLTEQAHNQPPVITPEFMNDAVGGIPAHYYVQKGLGGETLATLTWVTASRGYRLESTLDVTKIPGAKEIFFDLANSIPTE